MAQTPARQYAVTFVKGLCMGAANIIPGVSGGTVALITGIFERLIDALKSFDAAALRLLAARDLRGFIRHTDLFFLIAVFGGAGSGIFSLAFVLKPLFANAPVYVWAFFFGLIIASVVSVARSVSKFSAGTVLFFLAGTAIAVLISTVLEPAAENPAAWYVFLCGIVATCSMILPGLSGSFVLILMGNYELIMIDAVKGLNFAVLLPLMAGAGFGMAAFSRFLSWVFKKYRDFTIAILAGFIFGSLGVLWPWKTAIIRTLATGKEKVVGYHWFIPGTFNAQVAGALALMLAGIAVIIIMEKLAARPSVEK